MPRGGNRFVATVLFTDVVGSTEMAADVGDRRWNAVLRVYYEACRREVRKFHGREIDTAGDGFFATFDAPNDGVRAAAAIVESMWARGVPIRAGLHAGECENVDGKVGGIAVHIGARVASLAGAGEVVVTSTVRDLAAGSALRFDSMGTRQLKGVPGEWNVFEVGSEAARPDLPPLDVPDPGGSGRGRNRRPALIAGIVAAAVAIGIVVALVIGDSNGSPGVATSPPGSPTGAASSTGTPSGTAGGQFLGAVAVDSGTGKEAARVPINLTSNGDVSGHDITSGFGFVWVSDFFGNSLSKINPSTGTVVASISVRFPTTVLVHGKDVWVASGSPGCQNHCRLVRIDATTNEKTGSLDVDACCGGMAIDAGSLWVLGVQDLTRVSLDTGKAERHYDIGGDAVAAGGGRVFVLSRGLGTLTTLNERTGVIGDPVPLTSTAPTFLAYGFGAVWITDRANDLVTRLPVNGRGGGDEIPVGSEPVGVTRGPDAMWVANAGEGTVTKIGSGGSVEGTETPGGRPTRLTVAFGSVWVTDVPTPT
jgi:class 3 adenylate cyclase